MSVAPPKPQIEGRIYIGETGIYYDTVPSSFGCDSITTLDLLVHPVYDMVIDTSICFGDTLYYRGDTLTQQNIYSYPLFSQFGCDSLVHINLNLNPSPVIDQLAKICEGDSLLFSEKYISEPGNYIDSLQTTLGCDSIILLTLVVLPNSDSTIVQEICEGDSILVGGAYFDEEGFYEIIVPNKVGCDSLITLMLELQELPSTGFIDTLICPGDIFEFNGLLLEEAGVYFDTSNVELCDSITQLSLQFFSPPEIDTIILEDTGLGNGSIGVITPLDSSLYSFLWSTGDTTHTILDLEFGDYDLTLTDPNGCNYVFEFTVGLMSSTQHLTNYEISFFPNPTKGLLNYRNKGADHVEIFDISGNKVFESQLKVSGTLKLSLSAGIYVCIAKNNGNSISVSRLMITPN